MRTARLPTVRVLVAATRCVREMSIPEVGVSIPRGEGEYPKGFSKGAEYTRNGACTRELVLAPPGMGPRILTRPL